MTTTSASEASTFALQDGRLATIRPLTLADAGAVRAAVGRADPFDLRRRFMGSPPPTHVLLRLLAQADGVHDAAYGAFDETGRLVGVAQFDRRSDEPRAEVALEVARDWQCGGLGRELARRIAALALSQGIDLFTVNYLADNGAVERMVRESGKSGPPSIAAGRATAEIDLRSLPPMSTARD